EDSEAIALIQHVEELLRFLLPLYQRERRSYLTIAIGCTGGRHRSVAIAGDLCERLAALGYQVGLKHRDIDKS
ncbi:MAG: RNase adaptor protein RapZ, partial [Nitrospira sp. UW-LDO-01]